MVLYIGSQMDNGFCLSEKRKTRVTKHNEFDDFYLEKDVKEFIKRRNRLDNDLRNNRITWAKFLDERRKLAGEKLIQKS